MMQLLQHTISNERNGKLAPKADCLFAAYAFSGRIGQKLHR